MRKVEVVGNIGGTVEEKLDWCITMIKELAAASGESDPVDIAQNFEIDGTLTETRTIDVDTPDLANVTAVLGTIISDLQRGGQFRTT